MMSFNKKQIKFSLIFVLALTMPKLHACEFSSQENQGEPFQGEELAHIKTRFKYRDDQTLHLVAAGVGYNCYKGVPSETFEKSVQALVHKHSSHFGVIYEYHPDVYSPLSSLYRNLTNKWSDEQIQQAAIITEIYSQYESPMPKTFSTQGPSLLHVMFSKSIATYPELNSIHSYFEALFDEKVSTSTDKVFLTYAYIFYRLEYGQEEASSRLASRVKLLQTDVTSQVEKLKAEYIDNPYNVLENFLKTPDAWRLCMDFNQQRRGKYWVNYEMYEPGTIPSLLKGFNFLLSTQSKKLDINYLEQLHDIAFEHSDKKPSRGLSYGLPDITLSFLLESKKYHPVAAVSLKQISNGFMFSMSMTHVDNLNSHLKGFIEDYYDVIEDETATFGEKLIASNELSHVLVITHPYTDGNTRTFTTLLLNKTLMDLGLPPSLFEDPNAFDGCTSPEALSLILKGFENFKNVRDAKLPEGMRTTQEWIELKEKYQERVDFIPTPSIKPKKRWYSKLSFTDRLFLRS